MSASNARARVREFTDRFGIALPILEAPMAGICPPERAIAVARAGGMGAMGAVLSTPAQIESWAATVRASTDGPFQMNLWMPEAADQRDVAVETRMRALLAGFGPQVPEAAGDFTPPDFLAQCETILDLRPAAISSIMGLFPADFVRRLKQAGIAWFACATTLGEALAAEAAGADAVVAQGIEAGGHRGTFDPHRAGEVGIGLISLVPQLADHLRVPVIAAGGIADGRGVAAALLLGASAVQVGTVLLRAPESRAPRAWSARLAALAPEDTVITRAFSGRPGRGIHNRFVETVEDLAVEIPPYPVQRGLTATMRAEAVRADNLDAMQAWAGQSAGLAPEDGAETIIRDLWSSADALLRR